MKKLDDKKIKGISIELDKSTKLNELDDTILDFQKNTDDKHEIDVRVDIQNTTLHMKRIKKHGNILLYFFIGRGLYKESSLCYN